MVVGVAVFVRTDGKALWRYFEPVVTNVEPTQAAEDAEGSTEPETSKIVEFTAPYTDDVKV